MTTFYLVRHGSNDFLGKALAGRLPNVHLNEQGKAEAERATARLKTCGIQHIYSSPMERCLETAAPLAKALKLETKILDSVIEVSFGEWQGATMKSLDADDRWKSWNAFRTGHVIPNGETMVAIQARIASEMIRLTHLHPGETLALYSHGDPIRAALCYWLGMPLDFLQRLEVDPGSVSIVSVHDRGAVVHAINRL